jgi:hypothetical protein
VSAAQPPSFCVAVTGHRSAIPGGYWTANPIQRMDISRPGVHLLRSYLDGVLYRRRDVGRVQVLCRGGPAGVDHAVRSYCEARALPCFPVDQMRDLWADDAPVRRDLAMIARAHALVWFGPREEGPDPVTLAAVLGIPYRVCDLNVTGDQIPVMSRNQGDG